MILNLHIFSRISHAYCLHQSLNRICLQTRIELISQTGVAPPPFFPKKKRSNFPYKASQSFSAYAALKKSFSMKINCMVCNQDLNVNEVFSASNAHEIV